MSPLKIGLIGAGRIAGAHIKAAKAFPDRLRFTAIFDVCPEAAQARAAEAAGATTYSDLDRMLREADIDAVDICSVSCFHAQQTIAAASLGKHVLVEKPMATTMPDARAMVAACDKAGVRLMVAHNQRYMANYRAVKRAIAAGELGDIRAVRVESLGMSGPNPGHWTRDGHLGGGGVVISLAIHRIDLARYFVGEIKRVNAICRTTRPEFINGAEDWCWARMEFENGAIGDLLTTWSAFRIPWGESFIVYGEKGTVHALPPFVKYREPSLIASEMRTPPADPADRTLKTRGFLPLDLDREGLPTGEMYIDELLHFEECCRTGREPATSGHDNLGTMRAVFAIYESARQGQTVELEEIDRPTANERAPSTTRS